MSGLIERLKEIEGYLQEKHQGAYMRTIIETKQQLAKLAQKLFEGKILMGDAVLEIDSLKKELAQKESSLENANNQIERMREQLAQERDGNKFMKTKLRSMGYCEHGLWYPNGQCTKCNQPLEVGDAINAVQERPPENTHTSTSKFFVCRSDGKFLLDTCKGYDTPFPLEITENDFGYKNNQAQFPFFEAIDIAKTLTKQFPNYKFEATDIPF